MEIHMEFVGTSPLLMHRPVLVDPTHPLSREMKSLTSKRKKTEDDYLSIALLEWNAGLYHDEEVGPFLPAEMVEQCFIEAGKITKSGKDVQRALVVVDDKLPLLYSGPRDRDGLWEQGFKDLRNVRVQRASTIRCRPIFREWKVKGTAHLDTTILDLDIFKAIAERAGTACGLGDYRPRFGRFELTLS